jgi:hypothetical protein
MRRRVEETFPQSKSGDCFECLWWPWSESLKRWERGDPKTHRVLSHRPKLGVMATTTMNADDFASMLDRAIMRSGIKQIEQKQIEHQPSSVSSPAPIPPHGSGPRQGLQGTPDRRFRR